MFKHAAGLVPHSWWGMALPYVLFKVMTLILPLLPQPGGEVTLFNSFPSLMPIKAQDKARCCDALPSFEPGLRDAEGLGCSIGTKPLRHCSVRLVAQLWCGAIARGPSGSAQGQHCRDPRRRQNQTLLQSRNSFSPLKMLQNKDPPNPLSSRCKKWSWTKGLLRVTTTHSLRHFAGVGKQKTASGDISRGTSKLPPSPRVCGM